MDLLIPSDSEVISREVKNIGFAMDNQTVCPKEVPSFTEYLSALSVYGITVITCGAIAVLLVLIIFIDTLKYIMKNSSPRVKAHSALVIGVYPVVAVAAFCATLVPRAQLLSEAMTQASFMVGMYQLFCLCVAYCGGEAELIRKVKPEALNMKVGPCCFWPCCCFPTLEITKHRVRYLRLLVLQLPVVQGLVYMTLLVMWAERESLYQVNYMYFQPIIIISILFGIWGMLMTINLLKDVLKDFSMPAKFMVLQFVLLIAKLQGLAFRIAAWTGLLPCRDPINSEVYGNVIHNTLMMGEMVLLGILARNLYKKVLPDQETKMCVIKTIGSIVEELQFSNNNNTHIPNLQSNDNKV
ncbi:PREDICTED: organic solute transporter alpha-like protein [Nicrophorus vespilloides]|uniref:Organic solute transporter alpha-like protein n=1 Tax=Nicrophorus vespilloides TaxID=110193 RepID=A0ABM1MMC1_NICVS|nr:PREDICTED: organic solute transporter alpha-like protein [Nicrophorus vespilloides]